jgi:hypothetical protein
MLRHLRAHLIQPLLVRQLDAAPNLDAVQSPMYDKVQDCLPNLKRLTAEWRLCEQQCNCYSETEKYCLDCMFAFYYCILFVGNRFSHQIIEKPSLLSRIQEEAKRIFQG